MFRGFDFSDEGFYLNSILDPWAYDSTPTQFGLIYHFPFRLLGRDIALFRLANFAVVFVTNLVLVALLFRLFFTHSIASDKFVSRSLAFTLATVSSCVYVLWLPTPNYNLLNYIALSLTLIGVCLVQLARYRSRAGLPESWPGWVLIGIGGFLVFMARPQSAAGLAVLVTLWAALSGSFRPSGFLLAAALAFGLLFGAALVLDGSAAGFIDRYRRAVDIENMTRAHKVSALITLSPKFVVERLLTPRLAAVAALLLACGASLGRASLEPASKVPDPGGQNKFAWPVLFLVAAFLAAASLGPVFLPLENAFEKAFIVVCVPLGLLLFDLLSRPPRLPGKSALGWAAVFCASALIYCLGSNNQLAVPLSASSFFLLLGLSVLAVRDDPSAPARMAGLALAGLLAIAALMASSWSGPYRQPTPLWADTVAVPVPSDGGPLILSEPQAKFFGQLYEIVRRDFAPGTPVVDLTGRLPGMIYAMGGFTPKTPWMFSGWEGSVETAVFSLNRLVCRELASAWVIMAEDPAPFHFDPGILSEAGLDHQYHYQLAGRVGLPFPGPAGSPVVLNLLLLKPMDGWESRAEACQARRDAAAR